MFHITIYIMEFYSLYLYRHQDSNLTTETFTDYMDAHLADRVDKSVDITTWYHSRLQMFFLYLANEKDEPCGDFGEYKSLKFCFTVWFFRPRFFAYEAFDVLEKMAEDLDLYFANPQETFFPEKPQKFDIN